MRPTCHLDSVPRRSTKKSERDLDDDDAGMPTADLTEKRGLPSVSHLGGAPSRRITAAAPFQDAAAEGNPLSAGVRWYVP
jgi:hypothetical protein